MDIATRKKISDIAKELMNVGYLGEAQRFLEESIIACPSDHIFLYQLGTCFDRQSKEVWGDKRDALRQESAIMFMAASNNKPTDYYSANMAGLQLFKIGKYEASLGYLHRAHDLRPYDVGTIKSIAGAYEGLADKGNAIKFYEKLAAIRSRQADFAAARLSTLRA